MLHNLLHSSFSQFWYAIFKRIKANCTTDMTLHGYNYISLYFVICPPYRKMFQMRTVKCNDTHVLGYVPAIF